MQTDVMRQKLFNIRFSEDEWARLEALTQHLGVNAANLVRMLLKEKARELGLDAPNLAEATVARRKLYADQGLPVPPAAPFVPAKKTTAKKGGGR